jgi:hypothetical protein
MPTVGDAVEALNDLCLDLTDALQQIADLSAELASRDHVRVDNIQEVHSTLLHYITLSLISIFSRWSMYQTPVSYKSSISDKNGLWFAENLNTIKPTPKAERRQC